MAVVVHGGLFGNPQSSYTNLTEMGREALGIRGHIHHLDSQDILLERSGDLVSQLREWALWGLLRLAVGLIGATRPTS